MRINMKVGLVISLFSLVITGAIVGGFYFWRNSIDTFSVATSLGSSVYIVGTAEQKALETADVHINKDSIVSTQELDDLYIQFFSKNLFFTLLIICGVLFLCTMILWLILRNMYTKQTVSIIEELKFSNEPEKPEKLDKGIQKALGALREKYETNLEDYKRLSSYMTHDQKNTIAVLKSNLEQKEETGSELILLDRLTDIVDDILTLANNEDDQTAPVDVSLICAEVCDTYQKAYPRISFNFDEESNLEIIGKDRWIYRAVSNLLDNAVKYGENGDINVSVTTENNSVIIAVEDNGAGIEEEIQKRIFEHRYRVNGLKQDGYGIGLSVVAHVCDLCKGLAYVDSQKDNGSTFYMSFPAAENS